MAAACVSASPAVYALHAPSNPWASQSLPLMSSTWGPSPFALPLPLPSTSKPRLRLLPVSSAPAPAPVVCRFDPFADDDEPSPAPAPAPIPLRETQNTPLARGRPLTPLVVPSRTPSPAHAPPPMGRRRAPSFSAGSGVRLSALATPFSPSLLLTPAPSPSVGPSLLRRPPVPTSSPPPPKMEADGLSAPSPFLARHYPTPDARARLLARTLLHRIHAVGRPRSAASFSTLSMSGGYESETGARAYRPSRLSSSVEAC